MKNYRYLERRNMMIRRIGLWVGEVVAAILLAFLVIQFCFQTVTVHGDSMQPAYYDGDTVLVNKINRSGLPIFSLKFPDICVNTFALHLYSLQIFLY